MRHPVSKAIIKRTRLVETASVSLPCSPFWQPPCEATKKERRAFHYRVSPGFKEKLTEHLKRVRKPLSRCLEGTRENRLDVAKAEEQAYDRGYRDSAFDLTGLYLEDEEGSGGCSGDFESRRPAKEARHPSLAGAFL